MKKFKEGDKLRCIDGHHVVKAGEIYTFSRYINPKDTGPDGLIEVKEIKGRFFVSRFKVVEETMEDQIKKAYDILKSGKMFLHKNSKLYPSCVEIFTSPNNDSSQLVDAEIKKHGFCVAIKTTFGGVVPVNTIDTVSNIVQGVGKYDAIVNEDHIVVGCQTIPWSKVKEIVELHGELY